MPATYLYKFWKILLQKWFSYLPKMENQSLLFSDCQNLQIYFFLPVIVRWMIQTISINFTTKNVDLINQTLTYSTAIVKL